jgi:DedD protein
MDSELPDDSQLKRRARRRLIGAIALVLLAVIFLPMIFDAEKKPLDQDISIQIPSQGDYVSKAPPVAGPVGPPAQPAAPDQPAATPAETPPAAGAPTDAVKSDAPKETPKAEAPKAGPAPQAPKAEAKTDAKAAKDARSEAQKARELAEAKRAEALLNGAGTAPTSDKQAVQVAAGSFAVQIGAFATDEKVQEARDKLDAAGMKTYVEKVATKGGEVTRVRAGPYASKDAAQAALDKISALGFGGAKLVSR